MDVDLAAWTVIEYLPVMYCTYNASFGCIIGFTITTVSTCSGMGCGEFGAWDSTCAIAAGTWGTMPAQLLTWGATGGVTEVGWPSDELCRLWVSCAWKLFRSVVEFLPAVVVVGQ